MLALSRKKDEAIIINDNIEVKTKQVFNSTNKVWPNIGTLLEVVVSSGYKFFIWGKNV